MVRGYKLMHAHGTAGPKGRRTYFPVTQKTFTTKAAVHKEARRYPNLDGHRAVPSSKLALAKGQKKSDRVKLYYIKK